MPRIHCPIPVRLDTEFVLPPAAARHVQVLRMQPGENVTLFGGPATPDQMRVEGEFDAVILRMGRTEVLVRALSFVAVSREPAVAVRLAVGMPAADRMDWLVEKATELGVASIQPLMTERSVLRLSGERAEKKLHHWQAIAAAACEQCGRNTVPPIHGVADLRDWLSRLGKPTGTDRHWVLAPGGPLPGHAAWGLAETASVQTRFLLLSGPEGGLTPKELRVCDEAGMTAIGLGPRILRAETAPLAMLAALSLTR